MHYHYRFGMGSDGLLYQAVVYLKRVFSGFHKYGVQAVFGNSQDGSNIRVGRHNNLIALCHHTHLHISTQYQRERIKPIATAYTAICAYKVSVLLFKMLVFCALQVPSATYNACHRCLYFIGMQGRYLL